MKNVQLWNLLFRRSSQFWNESNYFDGIVQLNFFQFYWHVNKILVPIIFFGFLIAMVMGDSESERNSEW